MRTAMLFGGTRSVASQTYQKRSQNTITLQAPFPPEALESNPHATCAFHQNEVYANNRTRKAITLPKSKSCPELQSTTEITKARIATNCHGLCFPMLIPQKNNVEQSDICRARTGVLVGSPDVHNLAVALQGDEATGLHPLRAERRTCALEQLPKQYPLRGNISHWKQLFFASDSPIDGALAWKSWMHTWMELNNIFGDNVIPRDLGGTLDAFRDHRVEQLAGWADYHRTHVYVNYKNKFAFRIRPDLMARAHEKARLGRCIKIELGEEGARVYFTSLSRFYKAFNDVFVACCAVRDIEGAVESELGAFTPPQETEQMR